MEHPCYKCNAPVEDGTAFCPNCNAPQIRVSSAELIETLPSPLEATTIASTGLPTTKIDWSIGLPSAAIAGLVAAILMIVPLGTLGIGTIASGVLAVLLYRRKSLGDDLKPRAGAKLGIVTGILGFCISATFTAIQVLVFHTGGELRRLLIEAIRQAAARSPDPQAQQAMEYLQTPAGLALVMTLGLAFMLVAFLILTSLGGALGAVLLRRKNRGN